MSTSTFAQETCGLGVHPIDGLTFIKIGRYEGFDACGKSYIKDYFIPRFFKAYWYQVKTICETHGLDVNSLETKEESLNLLRLLKVQSSKDFYIGGMALKPKSKNDWYWISSGKKIDYDLAWAKDQPAGWSQPGWGNERCLSINTDIKGDKESLRFNDVFCDNYQSQKFVCESYKVKHGEKFVLQRRTSIGNDTME